MRMTPPAALTLAFGLCVTLAGIQNSPAAPPKAAKKPAVSPAAQIAAGKAVSEQNGCNTCHAATYAGKQGFSPSIRANGVTKQYILATWERVMDTGVTEDGGHVKKPMPVLPHARRQERTPLRLPEEPEVEASAHGDRTHRKTRRKRSSASSKPSSRGCGACTTATTSSSSRPPTCSPC